LSEEEEPECGGQKPHSGVGNGSTVARMSQSSNSFQKDLTLITTLSRTLKDWQKNPHYMGIEPDTHISIASANTY
jgi:hypothetical protein